MPLRFTMNDAQRAFDDWGANCGPGAIAAVVGVTLDELRPQLGDFERKCYTNPTLMWEVLDRLQVVWGLHTITPLAWPRYGLARVQWEGPWTAPGVPVRARYRHTHWVGAQWSEAKQEHGIFDINAMNSGGWISLSDWSDSLVPWLLEQCEPGNCGAWHLTHSVEVDCVGDKRIFEIPGVMKAKARRRVSASASNQSQGRLL